MYPHKVSRFLCLVAMVLVSPGCLELDVTNLNEPDRARALAEPGDLESLIAGNFATFLTLHTDAAVSTLIPVYGSEQTSTTPWHAVVRSTLEPRPPHENDSRTSISVRPQGPLTVWATLSDMAATSYDVLRTLEVEGISLGDAARTARAQAFGKFTQGMAWGYMAMLFDQALIIPETEPIQADPVQQGRNALVPWPQALEVALGVIDEAIAIAQTTSFVLPGSAASNVWFNQPEPMSSEEFVRMANTFAARLLVLSARTPQDRRNVDWNRVLAYTQNGLTSDVRFRVGQGFRNANLILYAAWDGPGCDNCSRLDYRTIGPADTSGQYQEWIASPTVDRRRFDIDTPDRRITGALPQSHGRYVYYRANDNGFLETDGLWRFSAYQYGRHGQDVGVQPESGYQTGHVPWIRADENVLLQAEAYLHLGNLQAAVERINVTRTRSHTLLDGVTYPGLPPVTVAGVPESADCVPRTDQGACGDIYTALRYERGVELALLDATRSYADNRAFGILVDGTPLQFAVSEVDLEQLGIPTYTFGGPGTEWGAVYNPVTYPW